MNSIVDQIDQENLQYRRQKARALVAQERQLQEQNSFMVFQLRMKLI